MTAQMGRIMRCSYAGVSKLRRRRAWESPLQTGYEHGQYDGRVQATMRCQLDRVR